MTVSTTHKLVNLTGDGVVDTFAFDFHTIDATDIRAYEDGVEDLNITVVLNADQEASPGGTCQFNTAPPANLALVDILRDTTPDQQIDYPLGGNFPSESHEGGLDKLTMLIQEAKELADLGIHFPLFEVNNGELPKASLRANKFLYFDVNGDILLSASSVVDPNAVQKAVPFVEGNLIEFNAAGNAKDSGKPLSAQKNYIINPTFFINQRVFAGGALADGIYGYDRWKAGGASNITLSGVIATIVSGTFVQVVEDFGYTGSVTISWAGTATVNGANTSPYTYTKTSGNDTLTFNTGTLSEVKMEIGAIATAFEYPELTTELTKCERFYQKTYDQDVAPGAASALEGRLTIRAGATSTSLIGLEFQFHTTMRANSTVTLYSPVTGASGNIRKETAVAADVAISSLDLPGTSSSGYVILAASAADTHKFGAHFTADAEL